MNIILAESQTLIRESIASLLDTLLADVCIDQAASGHEALAFQIGRRADLVVTGLKLPDFSGLELCRRLKKRWGQCRVLVVSSADEPVLVRQALAVGADGFVSCNCKPEELLKAIETVVQGQLYLEHELATRLAVAQHGLADSRLNNMTQRELEVMMMVARGASTRHIAHQLNITAKTVSNHLAVLKAKLDVGSSIELLHLAVNAGLVSYGQTAVSDDHDSQPVLYQSKGQPSHPSMKVPSKVA